MKKIRNKRKNKKQKKSCYHKWRFFNRWCQECSDFEFTRTSGDPSSRHGVIIHQCVKCGLMWDKENDDWTQEDIKNLFFNEFYWENSTYYVNKELMKKIEKQKENKNEQEPQPFGHEIYQLEKKAVKEINEYIEKEVKKKEINNDVDKITNIICPKCLKDMDICPKQIYYCQMCDFSFKGEDPCLGCEENVPTLDICRVRGFKNE